MWRRRKCLLDGSADGVSPLVRAWTSDAGKFVDAYDRCLGDGRFNITSAMVDARHWLEGDIFRLGSVISRLHGFDCLASTEQNDNATPNAW